MSSAANLFFYADIDQDGSISPDEAWRKFGITYDEFIYASQGLAWDGNAVLSDFADLLGSLYYGLKGVFWESEMYDMRVASNVLVKLADIDRSGGMSEVEAFVYGVSYGLFNSVRATRKK